MDERIVDCNQENDDEKIINLSLRPQTFGDFIGQKSVLRALDIAVQAARQRAEPLEHTLLSGPPGLGKTSLAFVIAKEMSGKLTATSGPAIERAGDLIGILSNLEKGDILFIDEIHRLSKTVEEFLYPAIENYQIDFVIDKGPYAKSVKFDLKPFTLIGATTRKGMLSAPLRSRFGLFFDFDFYTPEDLSLIIQRSSEILGIKIDRQSCQEIARRSRGVPRLCNRLLKRVRDYAQVLGTGTVTLENTVAALASISIDALGLDDLDRKYLRTLISLYHGGPAGIESITASLSEDRGTLEDVVEPYLLSTGFIIRASRGRIATPAAYTHLGIPVPDQNT